MLFLCKVISKMRKYNLHLITLQLTEGAILRKLSILHSCIIRRDETNKQTNKQKTTYISVLQLSKQINRLLPKNKSKNKASLFSPCPATLCNSVEKHSNYSEASNFFCNPTKYFSKEVG